MLPRATKGGRMMIRPYGRVTWGGKNGDRLPIDSTPPRPAWNALNWFALGGRQNDENYLILKLSTLCCHLQHL